MEIILLEKIDNLGAMGDKVNVKNGYGRNYLIPQGKGVPATEENIADYESRRAELEAAATATLGEAEARRDKLVDMALNIKANAGEEGKLFGSVGTSDIVSAVAANDVVIEKHEVRLPNGAFHQLGEYEVELHLHTDVNVTIKLVIEAE